MLIAGRYLYEWSHISLILDSFGVATSSVDFRALTHTRCRVAAEESKETVRFGNSLEYLV